MADKSESSGPPLHGLVWRSGAIRDLGELQPQCAQRALSTPGVAISAIDNDHPTFPGVSCNDPDIERGDIQA